MSTTIDQRVVEMRFDNRHFENNVQTTMSTLEKLKQKLNFSGASKGLDNLSSAAKNVKLDSLGSAVETVSAKFSAMDVIGVTALANITNQAVNAGKRIVSALTIDPIKTGLSEYETKINAIQVIQANTRGKNTMEDITTALEDLNRYADNTIYNFAQMTSNIGKFTAQGFDVYSAADAVKGMANLAAASGASAEDMARATYQMSQALGGTVKLMDWNSLRNANMATVELKNTLMDLARVQGIDIDSMIESKGTFEQTLQEGWLTGEMFSQAMNIYSGVYKDAELAAMGFTEEQIANFQDLAATAESAATEVKTFTQLWDVLKETAQSGWTRTWELLIGDFDTAKTMLTGLQIYFSDIINGFSDFRNGILERALGSPFGKLAEKIANVTGATEEMVDATKDYTEIVDKVISGEYGNGQSRWDKLAEEGYDWAKVQNMVNEKLGSSKRYTEELGEAQGDLQKTQVKTIDQLVKMSDAQLKEIGFTNSEIEAFRELEKQAELTGIPLEDILEDTSLLDGRSLMINGLQNAWSGLASAVGAVRDAFRETFFGDASTEEIMDSIASKVYNAIAAFHNFSTHLVMSDETVDKLKRTFKGLFAIVDIVSTLFGGAFKIGLKLVNAILGKFDLHILDVTAIVGDAIVGFRDFLYTILDFDAAAEWVINTFNNLKATVMSFVDKMKATPEIGEAWDNVVEKFVTVADTFKKLWNFIKKAITGGFEGTGVDIWDGLVFGLKHGAKAVWDAIASVARAVIETFKSILGIHSPSTVMIALGGFIIAGLVIGLTKFGPQIWEAIKGIGSKISEYFGDIKIGENIRETFKNAFDNMKEFISSIDWKAIFTGIVSAGVVYFAKKILDIFENFSNLFGGVGDFFDNISKPMEKAIKGFANLENSLAHNVNSKAIRNMVVSLILLVGALVALTFLPDDQFDKLWEAVGIITTLSLILVGLMFAMSKLSGTSAKFEKGKGFNIDGLKTGLLQIGLAILALAAVVKLLGEMEEDDIKQGFKAMSVMLLEMAIFMAAMVGINKFGSSKDIDKVGSMILKLSIAMLLMVGVCKLASKLSATEMLKGAAFATAFAIFAIAITKVAKSAGNNVGKVGGMLVKISIAMMLMVGVCKLAGKLSAEEMFKGAAFATAFVLFVKSLVGITKIGSKQQLAKVGGLMLSISFSLLLMIGVCKLVNILSLGDVIKGSIAILAFGAMIKALIKIVTIGRDDQIAQAASTITAMSLAIAIIAGVAILLSMIKIEYLAKGIAAVGILAFIMKGMIKATQGANKVTGNIVAMSVAIAVMAAAVALLSFIDQSKLLSSTLSLSILMGMFALISKSAGAMGNVMKPLITMTVAVGLLAGILYLLTKFGDPNESIKVATALGILLLALSTSMSMMKGDIGVSKGTLGSVAILAIIIGALGAIVGALEKYDVAPSIETAISLSILLLALSGVTAILSTLGKGKGIASGAFAGVVALGIVIAGLAIIIGALGAIVSKWDFVAEWIETGVPLMEKLGEGLGGFVGGIIGGFASSVSDGFKTLCQNLVDGVNAFAGIDSSAITGIKNMASFMGQMATVNIQDFWSTVLTFGTSTPMETFETNSVALIKTLSKLSQMLTSKEYPIDGAAIKKVAKLGELLTALAKDIPPDAGAVLGLFVFEQDLGNFAKDIEDYGEALQLISQAIGNDAIDFTAIKKSVSVGELFAALAKNLPESPGAVLSLFTMSQDLGNFGQDIANYSRMVILANGMLSTVDIDTEAFEQAKAIGDMFVILKNDLPESPGWILSAFTEFKDLGDFGLEIANYASCIKLANDTFSSMTIDTTAFDNATTIGKKMAGLKDDLPEQPGVFLKLFTEFKDLGSFGVEIANYAGCIKLACDSFSTIKTIDTTKFKNAISVGKKMAGLKDDLPEQPGAFLKLFTEFKDLGTFGDEIENFAKAIKTASDALTGENSIDLKAVENAKSAGELMIELDKAIPANKWFDGKVDLDKFGDKIESFGGSLATFSEKVSELNTAKVTTAVTAAEDLAALGGSMSEMNVENLNKFSGVVAIGTAMGLYGEAVKDIDTMIVTSSISSANKLMNLSNSLADINTSGINSFESVTEIGNTMSSYAAKMGNVDTQVLSSSITSANRLAKLIDGLSGLDTSGVGSFTEAIAELGTVSLETVAKAFSGDISKLKTVGTDIVDAIAGGFKAKQKDLVHMVTTAISDVIKKIDTTKAIFKVRGIETMSQFINGMNSQKTRLVTTMSNAASSGANAARNYWSSFYSAGSWLVSGFVSGISANTWRAEAQAKAMANAAEKAAKEALNINSPSKVFAAIGSGVVEGFVKGIDDNMGDTDSTIATMANLAREGFTTAMKGIDSLINSDMDMQPTITPVLDLSNVQSGVGSISSMLGLGSSIGLNANVGAVSSMMASRNQNGSESEVVSAINKLGKSLGNLGNTTYNVNGVSANDDAAVVDAVKTIIRAARIERRV